MFPTIDKSVGFPQRELAVGAFWKEREIYHKSLAAREGAPSFVFYEGPPTANGMPHPGHCLTRAIKDLFPRYKTMRGYRCERKAGWDTHGLPVEVEVCKELGIHSKEDIENFKSNEAGLPDGIEGFVQLCQQSVWRYMQEWRRLTERLGFWVDLDAAYVTYHQSYVESVWWSLKTLFDRGLLYRGHKIVWWWAQGGTALSAGEVGQGYRQVADPSVYVKFPIVYDETAVTLDLPIQTSLLVWTTTPWTLFSNMYVAVSIDIDYVVVRDNKVGDHLIVANDLVDSLQKKFSAEWTVLRTISGHDLRFTNYTQGGLRYRPPFPEVFYERPISDFAEFEETVNVSGDEDPYVKLDRNTPIGVFKAPYQLPIAKGSFAWHLVGGPFVTTDAGTGLVHIAPAFGEDDHLVWLYEAWDKFSEPFNEIFFNAVEPNGNFTKDVPSQYVGRWVKECDKEIIRDLKQRGLLYHQEQYLHDYPFCWRAEEDPLIQYPRESWFIQTTEYKDQMIANNAQINWLPEHIRDGRFGKFLESNVDWALSRERYWGTPLPIWVCSETGQMEAVGSYEELLAKPQAAGFEVWEAAKAANSDLPEDLRIHKPYIDAVTYASPFAEGARMTRVSEVIDCWYDSGAMPFAQWGYRGQESGPEREQFESQFPADFISEAIDQTRGWFYSQLAISTLLFSQESSAKSQEPGSRLSTLNSGLSYPHPFKNCIVLGLMLGEDGQKMSKSKRNYREPNEIFDKYGADALRWYLFANQPPWTSIRYSEEAIKDSIPEFLLRLWNVYSFFTIYANIAGFDPAGELASASGGSANQLTASELSKAKSYRPFAERNELDRWVLGELHATCAAVVERMDAYDNYGACQAITAFVDGLSNWYVRRSRDRYWAKETRSADKLDAYWTLYECLTTTSQLIAPFVPFLAEKLWQDLAVAVFGNSVAESVHLCDFPVGDEKIDRALAEQMDLVRLVSSLGRQARSAAELKVRQPLAKVEVILADTTHRQWLEEHAGVIAEELNVKAVEFTDSPEKYVEYEVLPNFKLLGPKLGKLMPKARGVLAQQSGAKLLADLNDKGQIDIVIDGQAVALTRDEVEVRIQAKAGWTSANDKGVVVVLATEISAELLAEGWMRDLVRVIQDQRKEVGCDFTDRIELAVVSKSSEFQQAVESFRDYVMKETLASNLHLKPLGGSPVSSTKIGDADVEVYLQVAP